MAWSIRVLVDVYDSLLLAAVLGAQITLENPTIP